MSGYATRKKIKPPHKRELKGGVGSVIVRENKEFFTSIKGQHYLAQMRYQLLHH